MVELEFGEYKPLFQMSKELKRLISNSSLGNGYEIKDYEKLGRIVDIIENFSDELTNTRDTHGNILEVNNLINECYNVIDNIIMISNIGIQLDDALEGFFANLSKRDNEIIITHSGSIKTQIAVQIIDRFGIKSNVSNLKIIFDMLYKELVEFLQKNKYNKSWGTINLRNGEIVITGNPKNKSIDIINSIPIEMWLS